MIDTEKTVQDGTIDAYNDYVFMHSKKGPKSDKRWFSKHPERHYRMRWAAPDESSGKLPSYVPDDYFLAVITHQVTPGGRVRVRFYWKGNLPIEEQEIAKIFKWHSEETRKAYTEDINQENIPFNLRPTYEVKSS